MSKKIVIALVSIISVFLIALVSGHVYLSKKLTTEEVTRLVTTELTKLFPNGNIDLKSVDISIGFTSKVRVDTVSISLKESSSSRPLFKVAELYVHLPIWAILFGGDTVEIKIDSPEIFYKEYPQGNNWGEAMGKKPLPTAPDIGVRLAPPAVSAAPKDEPLSPIIIPALLLKSKLNLKLSQVAFFYELKDQKSGQVLIEKFLVKKLNFVSDTAFEISTTFKSVDKKSENSAKALIIGELNLSKFLEKREFKAITNLILSDIKLGSAPLNLPTIKADMTLFATPKLTQGSCVIHFMDRNLFSFDFKKEISTFVENIKGEIFIADLLKIKNDLKLPLTAGEARLNIGGKILLEENKITPEVSINLKPAIVLNSQGVEIQTTLLFSYLKESINLTISNKLLGGSADLTLQGRHNLNELLGPSPFANMTPFDVKIYASNLVLKREFIADVLGYNKPKIAESRAALVQQNSKDVNLEKSESQTQNSSKPMPLPPMNIAMEISNLKVDAEPLSLVSKMSLVGTLISIKSFTLNYASGLLKMSSEVNLKNNQMTSKIDSTLTNFDLRGINPFLPPFVQKLSGVVNASVKGVLVSAKKLTFGFDVALKAKKGEIKGFRITDFITQLLAKLPQVAQKSYDVDQRFEQFEMVGTFSESKYDFKNYIFENSMSKISGSGAISPLEGVVGGLEFTLEDRTGKLGKPLASIGQKSLPLRLKSSGLNLALDYEYSAKKMVKSAAKEKGKELAEKAATKAVEKFIPPAQKEKVNKLLKGLFK